METNIKPIKPKTIKIAYWPDAFWITDLEGAELVDQINAFGDMRHQITEVDHNMDDAAIDQYIEQLIKTSEPPLSAA